MLCTVHVHVHVHVHKYIKADSGLTLDQQLQWIHRQNINIVAFFLIFLFIFSNLRRLRKNLFFRIKPYIIFYKYFFWRNKRIFSVHEDQLFIVSKLDKNNLKKNIQKRKKLNQHRNLKKRKCDFDKNNTIWWQNLNYIW